MQKKSIHIGTSGWHYKHWKGHFYPEDLNYRDWLEFYAKQLRTVEINNTFYQLPEKKTLEKWRDTVSSPFIFSVKSSRYITHIKKLRDPDQGFESFFPRIEVLGDKLGPILFQLPPRWHFDLERLKSFLQALPQNFRYTFEFRDSSWWREEVYDALKNHGAAFCIFELAGQLSPKQVTADFVYVRLHGPGDAYQGKYDNRTLAGWANAFSTWENQGKESFCYFDNDEKGYAAQNALSLQDMFKG